MGAYEELVAVKKELNEVNYRAAIRRWIKKVDDKFGKNNNYVTGGEVIGTTINLNLNREVSAEKIVDFLRTQTKKPIKYVKTAGRIEIKNAIKENLGENKMSKKKKEQLDEMIMLAPLVSINRPRLSLRGNQKDNFTFKGLPGQFDENGKKIYDEFGNKIHESKDLAKAIYEALNKKGAKLKENAIPVIKDILDKSKEEK